MFRKAEAMVINVKFQTLNGQTPTGVLSDQFPLPHHPSLAEFRTLIAKLFGERAVDEWAYICKGKQLRLKDEPAFNTQKKCITNNCLIQVGKRSISGSAYLSAHAFGQKFVAQVSQAVDMMPKMANVTCPICLTTGRLCFQFSCNKCSNKNSLCKNCFIEYLKVSDLKYKCLNCRKSIEILTIFPNISTLRALVETLNEMQELKRNIDCQICQCGEPKVTTKALMFS